MRRLILFSVFFFCITATKCQYIDSVLLSNYPVKNGVAYQWNYSNTYGCQLGVNNSVYIVSRVDSVFHSYAGKVFGIFNLGEGEIAVVLDGTPNVLFTYANMKSIVVKSGDYIKKGQFIGLMDYDVEVGRFCMDVFISENKKELPAEMILKRLISADKNDCIQLKTDVL